MNISSKNLEKQLTNPVLSLFIINVGIYPTLKLTPSAPATAGIPFISRVEDNVKVEDKLEVSKWINSKQINCV